MVVANGVKNAEVVVILDDVVNGIDIKLKCGIGKARTARKAAEMATKALDKIREYRKNGRAEQVFELNCL